MSNTRYFEIVSTYRNRIQFPNPSNFDVLISQTGTRDQMNAYDPVSDAAPLITWTNESKLSDESNLNPTGGEFVDNTSNTSLRFLVKFPRTSYLKKTCDYYIGMPISVNGLSNITVISGWEYNTSTPTPSPYDYFFVTISTPLPTTAIDGQIVKFENPTNPTTITQGLFYIPNSVPADWFYTSCILWNETQQNSAKILTYNGNNHIAGVDVSSITGWTVTDTLSIRKKPPTLVGRGITYTNSSKIVLQTTPSPTPYTPSNVPNEYVNNFIYFTSGANKGNSYRIVSYTGIPLPCPPPTPPPPYGCSPPPCIDDATPYEITLEKGVESMAGGDDTTFEILQFTRDNVVPFTYTGSTVSQQQMVCYEVELVNLVLPNLTLVTGGRVAFYPYVYVELQNISGSSGGNTNIIYSNNPHAVRRLFRAAIDDIPNPLISPFIKIDGDGMTQTIKFKPNDNFKFGVYLSDGREFKTAYEDSFGPAPPNPLVQISAMFSMKRVA
jgi:hypothetical protein